MKKSKGKLFVISGPSGAGEDSIIRGLKKFIQIEKLITTTTRDMRDDEVNGVDYHFISEEEFKKRLDSGDFFEHAQQYNDEFYGVTHQEIKRVRDCDEIGLWKIDYKGMLNVKKLMPEVKSILISAPLEVLEQRIRNRGKVSDEYVESRMVYTRDWLSHRGAYDFEVENKQGKLDEAIAEVLEIIRSN